MHSQHTQQHNCTGCCAICSRPLVLGTVVWVPLTHTVHSTHNTHNHTQINRVLRDLQPGSLVLGTVAWVDRNSARVRLDGIKGGPMGKLHVSKYSCSYTRNLDVSARVCSCVWGGEGVPAARSSCLQRAAGSNHCRQLAAGSNHCSEAHTPAAEIVLQHRLLWGAQHFDSGRRARAPPAAPPAGGCDARAQSETCGQNFRGARFRHPTG